MLSNLYNVLVIGIMQQEYKNSKIRTSISLVQISKSYAFCFSKFHIESESVGNLVPSITVFKLNDTIKCSVICRMPWQYNTILFFFYLFFVCYFLPLWPNFSHFNFSWQIAYAKCLQLG